MTTQPAWTGHGWTIIIHRHAVEIATEGGNEVYSGPDAAYLGVVRRWFRWQLVSRRSGVRRYRGLARADALTLRAALTDHMAHVRSVESAQAVRGRLETMRSTIGRVVAWHQAVEEMFNQADEARRWITREQVEDLHADRPDDPVIPAILRDTQLRSHMDPHQQAAFAALSADLTQRARDLNQRTLTRELTERRSFFDNVEKSALTREQAEAVITFDNRVRIIAAAGSGKTSVMVARAAYAVDKGYVDPGRILLLAFNKPAAAELQERIQDRLEPLGIDASHIRASTFHAFGLTVIGRAEGAKPRLAPWLDTANGVGMVNRIVDELRDNSPSFRYEWDLFRMVFGRALTTPSPGEPEWRDRGSKVLGYRTRRGETVRSKGEVMIANWLFANGVNYEYERPYLHPTATPDHSQYQPDFYYPDIDVWHEHWALDHDGQPPTEFHGYADAIRWKRDLHRRFGTTLIETTWADVMDGKGLDALETELKRRGVDLDWNPDRYAPGPEPLKHEELASLVRQFMAHTKSNSLTSRDLGARLGRLPSVNRYRNQLFLSIYWTIHDAWEQRLRDEGAIDFEDMLIRAADHLERGNVRPPYDLILVDEFQDASRARARLVRALVQERGKYLMTVGDDWQSINRFAGADLSTMTDFETWFGSGPTLRLETTFRCTQEVADVASAFVRKNPAQLDKVVRSSQGSSGSAGVSLARAATDDDVPHAIAARIQELSNRLSSGEIDSGSGPGGTVTIDVLGRYRRDRELVPDSQFPGLTVKFRTVHGSKGLEADYVIIPGLVRGRYGFPSEIEDDPVLDLVMADPDPFPNAEERRLLYVGLTRAKREVTLVTVAGRESPFVIELLKDGLVAVTGDENGDVELCPRCERGTLTVKNGRFGAFEACSRFPACDYTRSMTGTRA